MQPAKNTTLPLITLATLVAGVPGITSAAGFYLGAGGLGSELEPRVNQTSFTVTETNSSGARVFAGLDLSPRFSLEGYYAELGAASLSNSAVSGEIDYQAAGIAGLYYVYSSRGREGLQNREGLMFYGKAGLGFLSNNSTNGILFSRLNGEHLAAGLGMEFNFSNGFGLRAEFLNHDADARDFSINLVKRFGGGSKAPMAKLDEAMVEASDDNQPVEEAVPDAPPQEAPIDAPAEVPEPSLETTNVVEPPLPAKPVESVIADSDADGIPDDVDLCSGSVAGANVDESGCVFSGVIEGVNFSSGSAQLTPAATDALDGAITELSANPGLRISVQSHTDNRGSAPNNMELSRQRAVSVVRYLADVGNIDLSRMDAVGFGESQPLESNQSQEGRAANRRVEIEIIQQ